MTLNPRAHHGAEATSAQVKKDVRPVPKGEKRKLTKETLYTYAVRPLGQYAECWLARFTDTPCEGRLVRTHLLDKQVLKKAGIDPWDERSWVLSCGGLGHGNEAHHGDLDSGKLKVPRSELPKCVEELAAEIGAERRLYMRYGPIAEVA